MGSLSFILRQSSLLLALTLVNCNSPVLELKHPMESQVVADKAGAQAIAVHLLKSLKPGTEFVILDDKTLERPFGWVFFYTTRGYFETKDPGQLVPGTGPLAVMRSDGTTHFLPTSVPPPLAVSTFEQQWMATHSAVKN